MAIKLNPIWNEVRDEKGNFGYFNIQTKEHLSKKEYEERFSDKQ